MLQASSCNTGTTQTQPHQISNTQRTENKTTDVVIQQGSHTLLMMDILMSETCWVHKKWNKIASDIKLVFYSSDTTKLTVALRCFAKYSQKWKINYLFITYLLWRKCNLRKRILLHMDEPLALKVMLLCSYCNHNCLLFTMSLLTRSLLHLHLQVQREVGQQAGAAGSTVGDTVQDLHFLRV